jgi:uncharacterized phage-associated protein
MARNSRVHQAQLPPKLEAVLVGLCRKAPKPLSITQAVKMPYLVDVLAQAVLGRPITEGSHESWKYGVVTSEAWHYLQNLPEGTPFSVADVPFTEEIRVEAPGASSQTGLSEEEARIVEFVAEEYSYYSAIALGEMTKRMNPQVPSWGANRTADVGGDAYERMSPEYLEMVEAVAPLSLQELRRSSRPLTSAEDVFA